MRWTAKLLLVCAACVTLPAGFAVKTQYGGSAADIEPVAGMAASPALRPEQGSKPAASNPAITKTEVPSEPATDSATAAPTFMDGDKLRITFYDRVEFQEDKWSKASSVRPALAQRMELSGEYVVQDDGSIAVPLIGRVTTSGNTAQEVQAALQSGFDRLMGRPGFVTIVLLERQPVYVLGPVKNPGAYKYAPGLTVWHAIALAGGLDRATLEPWQAVESVRETEKGNSSMDHLIQTLARIAVLEAERDGTAVTLPARLVEIAGQAKARRALNLEIERRRVIVKSNDLHQGSLTTAVDNGKHEIETLSQRVAPIEDNVKLRDDRVRRMRDLASRSVVDNTVLNQAQSELLEIQDRRQSALEGIMLAKQRLAVAEQEKTRFETDAKTQREQDIDRLNQERLDLERDLAASSSVLNVIGRSSSRPAGLLSDDMITYEIVRHTPGGISVLSSTGTTALEPGDLVRLLPMRDSAQHLTESSALPEDSTTP
jgi:exopolysaccharide production protein ExoF